MEKLNSKNLLKYISPFFLVLLIGSICIVNISTTKTKIVNSILPKQVIFLPILKLTQNENGTFKVNSNNNSIDKSVNSNRLLSEQLNNLGQYLIVKINQQ